VCRHDGGDDPDEVATQVHDVRSSPWYDSLQNFCRGCKRHGSGGNVAQRQTGSHGARRAADGQQAKCQEVLKEIVDG